MKLYKVWKINQFHDYYDTLGSALGRGDEYILVLEVTPHTQVMSAVCFLDDVDMGICYGQDDVEVAENFADMALDAMKISDNAGFVSFYGVGEPLEKTPQVCKLDKGIGWVGQGAVALGFTRQAVLRCVTEISLEEYGTTTSE